MSSRGQVDLYAANSGQHLRTLDNPLTGSGKFGASVALVGSTIIVGAPEESGGLHSYSGKVYLFDANTGALLNSLQSPNPASFEYFGFSVAASGSFLVVGAYGTGSIPTSGSGSAYVFDVSTGALVRTLANPEPGTSDSFGWSVALSGNKAVVGARLDDQGGPDTGSAFVFDVTTGGVLAKLLDPTLARGDFGSSVAIAGETVVVGARYDGPQFSLQGAAYIFNTAGNLLKSLPGPVGQFEAFGTSVAITDSLVAVGAPGGVVEKVYVFDTAGNAVTTIATPNASSNVDFGGAVAALGNQFIVGAANSTFSLAYVYDPFASAVDAVLQGGDLTLTDNDLAGLDNDVLLSADGTNFYLTARGGFAATPAGGVLSADKKLLTIPRTILTGALTFNGLGGNDRLTVDYTGGDPVPAGGLTFDGGANRTAGDGLVVKGTGSQNATFHAQAGPAGSDLFVVQNSALIVLTNVEPVDVSDLAEFRFATARGEDHLTLAQGFDTATGSFPSLRVTGTSSGVPLAPVTVHNLFRFDLDAGFSDNLPPLLSTDDTIEFTGATMQGTGSVNVLHLDLLTGNNGVDTVNLTGPVAGPTWGNFDITTGTINVNASISSVSYANWYARESINDGNGPTLNLGTSISNLNAASGINLDIATYYLDAIVSGTGDINLRNDFGGAIELRNVQANQGNVSISTSANPTVMRVTKVAASGTVTLINLGSPIVDWNGAANNITASALKLSASAGIGSSGDSLEIDVDRLAASGGTGGVYIAAAGSLTIGTVDGLNGVSATGGTNIVAVIGGEVIVEGTAGSDDFWFNRDPGGNVQYARNGGAPVRLPGLTKITFQGLAGDDRLTVDYGGGDPVPSGGVSFEGGAQASAAGDSLVVRGTTTQRVAFAPSSVSGSGAITVDVGSITLAGAESLAVASVALFELSLTASGNDVTLAGGGLGANPPAAHLLAGTAQGAAFPTISVSNTPDVSVSATNGAQRNELTYDVAGLANPGLAVITPTGGKFTAQGYTPVLFVGFDQINTVHAPQTGLDVVLNAASLGLENGTADVIDLARGQGAHQGGDAILATINGQLRFNFEEQTLDSLRFVGSADDETLLLRASAAGMFALSGPTQGAAGVETGADNALLAGKPHLQFDGGGGFDRLRYQFLPGGPLYNQSYAFGDGQGSGAASGELLTVDEQGNERSRVYFTGLEEVRSPGAGGALTVLGDSGDNLLTVAPGAAGFTRISMSGPFVPLDVGDDGFASLSLFGMGGSDTLDFQAMSAAYTSLASLLLDGDSNTGGDLSTDTIQLRSLPPSTAATLRGGAGDDQFLLSSSSAAPASGSADAILGAVSVSPTGGDEAGTDRLVVDDSQGAAGGTLTITKTMLDGLTGSAGLDVTYANIDDLRVDADGGTNTLNFDFLAVVVGSDLKTVTLDGGAGDDVFLPAAVDATSAANPITQLQRLMLIGGPGLDTFGSALAPQRIRPATSTEIVIAGDMASEAPAGEEGGPANVLYLDFAAIASGVYLSPTGQALSAGAQPLSFSQIVDLHLFDGPNYAASSAQTWVPGEWYVPALQISRSDLLQNQEQAAAGQVTLPPSPPGKTFTLSVLDSRFELAAGNVLRLKTNESILSAPGTSIDVGIAVRDEQSQIATKTIALNIVANAFPWHNNLLAEDADNNGQRNLDDAVFIIRQLRRGFGGSLAIPRPAVAHTADVAANNRLDVQDAVAVIKFLRRQQGGGGEGESQPAAAISALSTSSAGQSAAAEAPPSIDDLALLALTEELAQRKRNAN